MRTAPLDLASCTAWPTTFTASGVRFDLLKSKKTMKVFTAGGGMGAGGGGGGGGAGGGGSYATRSSRAPGYQRKPAITACSLTSCVRMVGASTALSLPPGIER